MTGIEIGPVAAKATSAVVAKLAGAAVSPFIENVKRNLARKGRGRTDLYTALRYIEKEVPYLPSTLGLIFSLPRGMTQRHINEMSEVPELVSIARLVLSVEISSGGTTGYDKLEAALYEVFAKRYDGDDLDGLKNYVNMFFVALKGRARLIAEQLLVKLNQPAESLAWAVNNIAVDYVRSIEAHLSVLARDKSFDHRSLEEWRERYIDAFKARHSGIEVPDLAHRRTVDYEKLFVGSSLVPISGTSHNVVADLSRSSSAAYERINEEQVIPLLGRTVFLGDPGAGKSTTSTLIALRAWETLKVIPVIIVLKHVKFSAGGFSVIEEAEKRIRSVYQCPAPEGLLQRLLLDGKILLVFDGLDELLDGRTRRDAVEVIETIAKLYPFVKVLVTSRSIGYAVARLDVELFDEFQIDSFDDRQVRSYISKWLRIQREDLTTNDLTDLVNDLMVSTESLTDLRKNPLLLAFICVLYTGHRHIPRRRPELYRKCVELLLTEWDRARDITSTVAEIEVYEVALTRLAYLVLVVPKYRDGLTEHDVYAEVVPALIEESVPDERTARAVVRDLLALCRGRAWIFTDVGLNELGDEIFSFTHTSFMEYFAARYIDRVSETPEILAEKILPEIGAGRWEILGQICLALRDRHAVAGASRAFSYMLSRTTNVLRERFISQKKEALEWSGARQKSTPARTFEDVAVVEFLLKASDTLALSADALNGLVEIALDQMADGRSGALASILDKRYRYADVAKGKLASLLNDAMTSFVLQDASSVDPLTPAKVWIATHVGYFLHSPSRYTVSRDSIEHLYRSIAVPEGDWSAIEARSDFTWNISLHLGRNMLNGGEIILNSYDGPAAYQRIFAPCGSPVRGVGPSCTVEWVVDCISSPNRSYLRSRHAIGLLDSLGKIFKGDFFELSIPPGAARWAHQGVQYRRVSNLLAAQRIDVFLGWLVVALGMLELGGGFLGSRDRKELRDGRSANLEDVDMLEVVRKYVARGLKESELIRDWLDGEVSFWTPDDMGVS